MNKTEFDNTIKKLEKFVKHSGKTSPEEKLKILFIFIREIKKENITVVMITNIINFIEINPPNYIRIKNKKLYDIIIDCDLNIKIYETFGSTKVFEKNKIPTNLYKVLKSYTNLSRISIEEFNLLFQKARFMALT